MTLTLDNPLVLALIVAFSWWFTTGLVFWLCRQRQQYFPLILGIGVVWFALSFQAFSWSLARTDLDGLVVGFFAGLSLWVFQELTFYLGYVTGPRREASPPGLTGWRLWMHALGASLYHEISILLTFAAMLLMGAGSDNQMALYTFVLIWVMHESARINVLGGVRNVNAEWLPTHLDFLRSFLRQAPLTTLFCISTGLIALLFVVQFDLIFALPFEGFHRSMMVMLTTLTGLALLEHICLVVPVPLTLLWRIFGAPSPEPSDTADSSPSRHASEDHLPKPAGGSREL